MSLRKFIPDFITSMNIVCGLIGVVSAFSSRLDLAFYLMILAAVFDYLDGFAARALGAYSELGKELDSLCDAVSFGVLPAVMMCVLMCWGSNPLIHPLCLVPLLLAVAAALRLAKFNVDKRQGSSFRGLATPPCALFCAALCCFVFKTREPWIMIMVTGPVFVPVLTVILCVLMLSDIPMFAFKLHSDDPKPLKVKRIVLIVLAVICLALCVVFSIHWAAAVMMVILLYVIECVLCALLKI